MKEIPLRTLLDDGLLFEINRRVLHPFGMALTLCLEDDHPDGEPVSVKLMSTGDPDGIVFTPGTFTEGESRFEAFMEREGLGRMAARRGILRFVEQESADQGQDSMRPPPTLD